LLPHRAAPILQQPEAQWLSRSQGGLILSWGRRIGGNKEATMMRLWVESYAAKTTAGSTSAFLSAVTHAVLISLSVLGTQKAVGVPEDSLANRVYYLPPPDRVPGQQERQERVQWLAIGVITNPLGQFADVPTGRSELGKRAAADPLDGLKFGTDTISLPALPAITGRDSAFSVLDVDSAVTRHPWSAAPAYPPEMLKKKLEGSVFVRYVVDTSGFADASSFQVLRSSHADFTAAVRSALPDMRFNPARIGPRRVRQLVEQEFSFKIVPDSTRVAADTGRKG
jgi:TonB family protein